MDDQTLELYIQSCYTNFKLRWSAEKDAKLHSERGASFLDMLGARVIGRKDNPTRPHQELIYVEFRDYVWLVPLVSGEGEVFLKTAFPSRKHTKRWRGGSPL